MKRAVFFAVLPVALLVGCAVPSSGIVPANDGLYSVMHQGNGFWVSPDTLRAAATQEGAAYCESKGKTVRVLYSKNISAAPGQFPEANVLFKCE